VHDQALPGFGRGDVRAREIVVAARPDLEPGAVRAADEPDAGRIEIENGEFRLDEDFAAVWDGPPDRNIFLQNAARSQRGLPDVNLSLNAWRAKRIADRLRGWRSAEPVPSFIEWSGKNARARDDRR
jgi:lysine/ornithine N-monooxygenase